MGKDERDCVPRSLRRNKASVINDENPGSDSLGRKHQYGIGAASRDQPGAIDGDFNN
jgi:hypothetical protein